MSDSNAGETRKRSWVKPVLVVSLAFNLLFAGLFAGAIWKRHHGKWRPKHIVLEMSIRDMMKELPADKRAAGEKALAELRGQFPEVWNRIRAERKEAVNALTADPYNEPRFTDALASLRKTYDGSRKTRHDAVIEFVRGMSVAERRRFVEVYRSNKRGPWDRHKAKKEK